MSNYTYTTGIPNGSLTPAQNRPTMTVNNNSNSSIWTEDHNGFNDNFGGTHQFLRLPNFSAPTVISEAANQGSALYTVDNSGGYAAAVFKNANAAGNTFILSCIKAWAQISTAPAVFQGFNVASVAVYNGQAGQYTITLTNALNGSNYAILANATGAVAAGSMTTGALMTYERVNNSSFRIYAKSNTSAATTNTEFSFVVLQI